MDAHNTFSRSDHVTVTNNGSAGVSGWEIELPFDQNPQVTGSWNVNLSTSGNTVIASDVGWNGSLSPGGSTSFGFQGNHNGSINEPPCVGDDGTGSSSSS